MPRRVEAGGASAMTKRHLVKRRWQRIPAVAAAVSIAGWVSRKRTDAHPMNDCLPSIAIGEAIARKDAGTSRAQDSSAAASGSRRLIVIINGSVGMRISSFTYQLDLDLER
jgi:hypothetical protein